MSEMSAAVGAMHFRPGIVALSKPSLLARNPTAPRALPPNSNARRSSVVPHADGLEMKESIRRIRRRQLLPGPASAVEAISASHRNRVGRETVSMVWAHRPGHSAVT